MPKFTQRDILTICIDSIRTTYLYTSAAERITIALQRGPGTGEIKVARFPELGCHEVVCCSGMFGSVGTWRRCSDQRESEVGENGTIIGINQDIALSYVSDDVEMWDGSAYTMKITMNDPLLVEISQSKRSFIHLDGVDDE